MCLRRTSSVRRTGCRSATSRRPSIGRWKVSTVPKGGRCATAPRVLRPHWQSSCRGWRTVVETVRAGGCVRLRSTRNWLCWPTGRWMRACSTGSGRRRRWFWAMLRRGGMGRGHTWRIGSRLRVCGLWARSRLRRWGVVRRRGVTPRGGACTCWTWSTVRKARCWCWRRWGTSAPSMGRR